MLVKIIAASVAVVPLLAATPVTISPDVATAPVSTDADDPAVWVHPDDPEKSLIVGTDKTAAPEGGLYVFGLDGKVRQRLRPLDRPNNVDVEYGLPLAGRTVDIVVTTERLKRRLRVYAVDPESGRLTDLAPAGLPVFAGERDERAAPMGVSLYKRPRDGAIFAIVSRKEGPLQGYLWQYRLRDDDRGGITADKVRSFGTFSGKGEIESVAVDDALGYVYYSDEGAGYRKWHADPDHPDADRELSVFGTEGVEGDREGIGIYVRPDETGYLVCTDQQKGNSLYRVYRREGEAGRPHDHSRTLAVLAGGADETDGIEVVSQSLGSRFPAGALIAMNSGPRNFLVFDWRRVDEALSRTAARSIRQTR